MVHKPVGILRFINKTEFLGSNNNVNNTKLFRLSYRIPKFEITPNQRKQASNGDKFLIKWPFLVKIHGSVDLKVGN